MHDVIVVKAGITAAPRLVTHHCGCSSEKSSDTPNLIEHFTKNRAELSDFFPNARF